MEDLVVAYDPLPAILAKLITCERVVLTNRMLVPHLSGNTVREFGQAMNLEALAFLPLLRQRITQVHVDEVAHA